MLSPANMTEKLSYQNSMGLVQNVIAAAELT